MLIAGILLVLTVFSAQNYEPVQLKLFAWSFRSSLAITVFISLVAGFLIGLLMGARKK
jgi:uncharacterized integral membrane protein